MSANHGFRTNFRSFFKSFEHFYNSFGRAYIVLLEFLVIIGVFILNAYGKLPPTVTAIITAIVGLIALPSAFWKYIRKYLSELWGHPSMAARISVWLTCFTVVIIVAVGVLFLPNSTAASISSGEAVSSSSKLSAPTATPSPTPTPPLTSSIAKGFIFRQSAPYCDNPSGTLWSTPLPGTYLACSRTGLIMHPVSPHNIAEVQLDQVNDLSYQLINVTVEVKLTFQKPTDTKIRAGLFMQTSQNSGYTFLLSPTGSWQLWFLGGQSINPTLVASGSVSINPGQPTTIEEKVQSGILDSYINGQEVDLQSNQVFGYVHDTVGLIVVSSSNTTSSVTYSNLTLKAI